MSLTNRKLPGNFVGKKQINSGNNVIVSTELHPSFCQEFPPTALPNNPEATADLGIPQKL
jgi:hypothetical protein